MAGAPSVRIEPLAPHHARGLQPIASDPRVQATTLLPDPYPPDGAARFIEFARGRWGQQYSFAIVDEAGVAGCIGVKEIHNGQGEVGYYVDPERWGRGIAGAALGHVCRFAFREAGLARLVAYALVSNAASWRVLERAGFERAGVAASPFAKWPPEALVARYVRHAPATASPEASGEGALTPRR